MKPDTLLDMITYMTAKVGLVHQLPFTCDRDGFAATFEKVIFFHSIMFSTLPLKMIIFNNNNNKSETDIFRHHSVAHLPFCGFVGHQLPHGHVLHHEEKCTGRSGRPASIRMLFSRRFFYSASFH